MESKTLLTRRAVLAWTAASLVEMGPRCTVSAQLGGGKLPVTGAANSDLEPFDRLMTSFVRENKVPGASLAVTRNSRLVYARGFGYAEVEHEEPVQPAALFRIASVSKPITAVAVLHLVERNKLKLENKVIDRMKLSPFLMPGTKPDERWKHITIRHCLQHTGGWDREKTYDPIGRPRVIAKALQSELPVSPAQIVRYMMGQPLDFDPGERYAYSNLGYLVLGRILEAVTGQGYATYVKKEILSPLGIKTMRLGRALLQHRGEGEVKYYDAKNRRGPALYPPLVGQAVPLQYGAENLEAFEAHGGWIASAVDLVRFATAWDNPARSPLLREKTIDAMWARPSGRVGKEPDGKPKAAFYGCGWMVRPVGNGGKSNNWHAGFIAGTEALLVRRWDGLNWAVLFNTAHNPEGKSLTGLIDGRIHQAADQVKHWPSNDQFAKFL